MTTTEKLTVKGIEIPKDDEKALFDAYRQDLGELGEIGLLAAELGLTINVYKPGLLPAGLEGSLEPGERKPLLVDERFVLSEPQQSVGKGARVIDLFFNKHTKRYEILGKENDRFVRTGNAGSEGDSLYHCMVNVLEPSVPAGSLASRVIYYKSQVRILKTASNDVIRVRLNDGVIPGNNVDDQLERISLQSVVMRKRLQKLVRHAREELDAAEPPQRDRSGYVGKLQVVRALVENLEYDYERKIKDFSFEQLVEEYRRIQLHRAIILSKGYTSPLDWERRDVNKKRLIKGSEDFKVAALTTILDDPQLGDNERFRLTSTLITSINPEKLKTAYMLIRQSNDVNKLETDLRLKFHAEGGPTSPLRRLGGLTKYFSVGQGHELQFPYLKSLLETGEQSPSAQLAMKLGLMYRGAQILNLTADQKDEIGQLVEENPGELAGLANVGGDGNMLDTNDQFLQASFANLKQHHPNVLSEMQNKLRHAEALKPISGIQTNAIAAMKFKNAAARSLIRLMFDAEKRQLRLVGSRIDTDPLKKKILSWIENCNTEKELTRFIKAGECKRASRPPNAYEVVWTLIDGQLLSVLERGNWKKYFVGMAKARLGIGREPEQMRPFYELEAFLKYKKSRGLLLSYKEKSDTLAKVMNMLSASDEWDPKAKLATLIKDHPDLRKRDDYEKYKDDPTIWLDELLEGACVDAEGREQIHALLYAGATYNGDKATDSARNIDNYLSLKRKAHRRYLNALAHGLTTENMLTIIGKVKPGSLEHWMLRKDKKLLTRIREELREQYIKRVEGQPVIDADKQKAINLAWSGIFQALDLGKKWSDLGSMSPEEGDSIMPEPLSKDELKGFKDRYKDEDIKKNIWAGKYTLTYSLTKDQSVFNISDRKELLKQVYAAQLEGYQGDVLMKILDDIDPKIRESLAKPFPPMWTNHERNAHKLLQDFLIKNQEIAFNDFLNVAKGVYTNDYSVIDFAVKDLSPEKSAKLWCSKSYNDLKAWSESRIKKTLQLHGFNARSPDARAEASKLEVEIADLDEKIKKHTFKIDDELRSQLQGLTRDGKTVEFERQLKQKIGETMLNEPEKFEDLHIQPFELSLKGVRLLGEADIEYQHYLRTGVGYHRFSVSGLEFYAQGSSFIRDLWKTAGAQPIGTAEERQKEEQELLKTFKKSHEDLIGSLDKWKDKQDEYTKRIVNLVNQTLGTSIAVALAVTGVGGVAFIALGPIKGALNTVVKMAVERALSREGDIPTQEIVKQVMVSAVAAVPGVLASVDYGDVPGLKKVIDNTIGSMMVKAQISSISKAIVGGVGDVVAASGDGNFEMSSKAFKDKIVKELQGYKLTEPQIYKTVLTGLSAELTKTVTDGITTGVTGMDKDAIDKLEGEEKAEVLAKAKLYTSLYKNMYNRAMAIKGYDLLTKAATTVASLPFADDVDIDKNKLEQESKSLAIANALVEALFEKGLRVDGNFDYSDVDKLIKQIAGKMPGVELTAEEIRTLAAELEDDDKFSEKQKTLTDDEKNLDEAEQKRILLDKEKEKLQTEKMEPWTRELNSMKTYLEQECDTVKAQAEKQAEKDSKELEADVNTANVADAVKKALTPDEKKAPNPSEASRYDLQQEDDEHIVARALATRMLYGRKKKKKKASEEKVANEWRRRQAKKAKKEAEN